MLSAGHICSLSLSDSHFLTGNTYYLHDKKIKKNKKAKIFHTTMFMRKFLLSGKKATIQIEQKAHASSNMILNKIQYIYIYILKIKVHY